MVPSNKRRRRMFIRKSFSKGLLRSSLWSSVAIVYIFLFSSFSRDETQCKVWYKNDLVFFARRSYSNRIMEGAGVNVYIFSLKYVISVFQGRSGIQQNMYRHLCKKKYQLLFLFSSIWSSDTLLFSFPEACLLIKI